MTQYRTNQPKELFMTHVRGEGPILKLWGLTTGAIELVRNFEYFFQTHAEELDHSSGFIRSDQTPKGFLCAVRSKIKQQWCRAVILSPLGQSIVLARLIDYGPEEQVSVADVRQLDNSIFRYEGQASECILADVEPSDRVQWSLEAIKMCENELLFNTMSILIISTYQNIPVVRIAKKGESEPFVQRLINDELAIIKPRTPSPTTVMPMAYKMNTLNPSTSHLVKISYVENAQKFYVQLSAAEKELMKLMEEIQNFASRPENLCLLNLPQVNQACLSNHKHRYYRCRIVSFNQGMCAVSFVDYGFTEVKPFQELKAIHPRFLQLHAQAICCTLPKDFHIATDDFWRVLNNYPFLECESLAHTGESYVVRLKSNGRDIFLPPAQNNVVQFSSTPSFSYKKLVNNERCEVNIGYINDISDFYCQLVQSKRELDAITAMLSTGNDLRPMSFQECQPKIPVCAKFSEDNEWYRAEIVKVNHERDIEVFFVDFGNFDNATLKDLRKISKDLLNHPVQAYKCSLADIDLPAESSLKDEMFEYFEELTAGQSLQALVKEISEDDMGQSYSVILQEKSGSVSINDKIQNKFFNLVVIPIAEVETLYITSFTSLDSFFGQFEKLSSSKLDEMQEEINEFYREAQNTTYVPKPGDKVCARYNVDNQYYRARVEVCSGKTCHVVFLDYGNRESISVNDIHPMNKQFLKYPLFGVECAFSHYPEATPVSKVQDLMLENSIQARMIEEKNNKWLISLTEDFSPNVHVLEIFRQHERVVPRSSHGGNLSGPSDAVPKRENDRSYSLPYSNNNQNHQSYNKSLSSESKNENSSNLDEPKHLTQINIPSKAYRNVYVSHVISPSEFYCQIEEESTKLQQLMQNIEDAYSQVRGDELKLKELKIGSVCCAVFSEDSAWYRGSIKQVGCESCGIYFVDYGNTDFVPVSKIKALNNNLLDLPAQAIKCKLFNAEPDSNTWSKEAIQDFINLTLDKSFVAQFVEADNTNTYAVNLVSLNKLEEDVLNKQFVNRGHGKLQDKSKLLVLNSHAASSNLSFKTPVVNLGSTEQVTVCYGLTQQVVFCQLNSYQSEFKDMMKQLQHHYNKLSSSDAIVDRPHVGMICVAQFHLDSVWYRGRVTKMDKSGISVIYVDYGNTEIVEKKKIRCIAQDFTILPVQAIKCHIRGVGCPDKSWSSKNNISKYFEGDAECQFVSKEDDHYIINLTVNQKNVAELLIKSGLAVGDIIKNEDTVQDKQPDLPESQPDELVSKRDPFSPGQLLSVAVSYTKTPYQFWCQSLDDSDVLDQLTADIESHIEKGVAPINLDKLIPGYYCLAKYSADEAWYRAQVVSRISAEEYEVFFIDFGNTEITPPSVISELPQNLRNTHNLCFCCQLLGSSTSNCTTEVNAAFQNIVDEAGQDMTAKIDQVLDETYVITLLYEVNDVEKNVSAVLFPDGFNTSPSAVPETATKFLPPDVPLGLQEGYVTIVNSPHDFFIQLAGCEDKLTELATELSELCEALSADQNVVPSPVIGLACAVKYSEDESWYRAEIINLDDSSVDVLFVDYGNVSTVPKTDLKVLEDKFLSASPYAIRCKLNGIVPCKGDQWSENVITTFQDSVLDSPLGITFICKDLPAVVNLSKDDKDIGQTLVDLELANVDTCAETDEAYTDDHLAAPIEDNLHSMPMDQSYPKRKLTSTKLLVKICYVDSYTKFYVMPKELSTELDTVMKTLEILYTEGAEESNQNALEEPKAFLPCVAQYSEDELWYRARITEVDGDNIYVSFVDYGNSEVSSLKNLRPLTPELLKIPPIAMECSLYAIQAVEGKDQDLLTKLEEYFVDEVVLEMEVYKPEEPYKVRLYHNGSDIAELFCNDGLAKEVIPPPETIVDVTNNVCSNLTDDVKNSLLETPEEKVGSEFQPRVMPLAEKLSVNVKHCEVVDDKIVLFAVPVNLEDDLATFQENLQIVYSENQPSLENITVSKCCVAKYVEDENWYRAKILNCNEEEIRVQFVDYGNSETVDRNNLKELLPDFAPEPLYSFKFCSRGLLVEEAEKVREKLDAKLYDGSVDLHLCNYCNSQDSVCFTSLICESENLLEHLLNESLVSQTFIFNDSLGEKFQGVIEGVIGNVFYVLPSSLCKERDEMMTQLMEQLHDTSASLDDINPSLLYAAKIEDKWNRVSIISPSETDSLVLCVDYGVNATAELSHLAPLPLEFYHKPLFLHPCSLKDYEEMPLECREIILKGIENSKTFHFEIDKECSNDLLLEVKILADNTDDSSENKNDQKYPSPQDEMTDFNDSVSSDTHKPETAMMKAEPNVLIDTSHQKLEEITPLDKNEEHISEKPEKTGDTSEVSGVSKLPDLIPFPGDAKNNEKFKSNVQQFEDILIEGKCDISEDNSKETNYEITENGSGKGNNVSDSVHKDEDQKEIDLLKTKSNFDECEDETRSDDSPESTELQDSEYERARELSDVESEIKTFNPQELERDSLPLEISNTTNENLDLYVDDQDNFSQEPESSGCQPMNEGSFLQEPESLSLEHPKEENFNQEPESSCLEHVNEQENFSLEPESSCLEHLDEAANFSQEPESSCLEYSNEAEDFSQEPESTCLEHLTEPEDFSQEPESSFMIDAKNFSRESEISCSEQLNEAENVFQKPESSCSIEAENLSQESESFSQEPESSCLEHLNEVENISQEPESSCLENMNEVDTNFSQEPESLCSEHSNRTELNSSSPQSEVTISNYLTTESKPGECALEVNIGSLSGSFPKTASKLQNDGNVMEDNDWDERPECDIKEELLAHGKDSKPTTVAAKWEAQDENNLPSEIGVLSPEEDKSSDYGKSENQQKLDVNTEVKSNSSECVNNHLQDLSLNEEQTVKQLQELAGDACALTQQIELIDHPHKLMDGCVNVSHVTVSAGSLLFPAIPKYLLPKLCQFKGILQQTYSLELPIPDSVTVSDLYAVFYEGEWYRGKVLDTKDDLVTVIFTDNGSSVEVELTAVRPLKDEHKVVPPFALWCVLASAFCLPQNEAVLQVFLDAMLADAQNTKQDIAVKVVQEEEPYLVNLLIEDNDLLNVLLSEKQVVQRLNSSPVVTGENLAKVSHLSFSDHIEMHINLVHDLERLEELNGLMQLIYKADKPKLPIVESGVYAVQHKSVWKRGQAVSGPDGLCIQLVDSGKKIDLTDVYPLLPEHCLLPPCAILCEIDLDNNVTNCDPSDALRILNEKEIKVLIMVSAAGGEITAKVADEHFLNHLNEILTSFPTKH